MTVEAAVLLPLTVLFFLQIAGCMETFRLHNRLQTSLNNVGSKLALYGYHLEDHGVADLFSAVYVKQKVKSQIGSEYLNRSFVRNGEKGLHIYESELITEDEYLDLTLTYKVQPMFALLGFNPFTLSNHVYLHLWNGYEIKQQAEEAIYAYVTQSGQVYHRNRECTHLRLSVSQVQYALIAELRNRQGEIYYPCKLCVHALPGEVVWVTQDGNRYHAKESCSGLKRTIRGITRKEAENYRPCKRCS